MVRSIVYYNGFPLVGIHHNEYIEYNLLKRWYAEKYGMDFNKIMLIPDPVSITCDLNPNEKEIKD